MLEGRTELEEGDPELLGGVDEMEEEETREEVPLGSGLEEEPPIGRELAPLIWFCSSAVKVPVIPVNVNLAEKAKAGYWGEFGSLRERDSIRMKLNVSGRKGRVSHNRSGWFKARTIGQSWVQW